MNAPRDVIDELAGIEPGSWLDKLRAQRPEARENVQKSYLALFEPSDPAGVSLQERHAVGAFVAGLHRRPDFAAFYASTLGGLAAPELAAAVAAEVAAHAAAGPFGSYPPGPLSVENSEGPSYRVAAARREALGRRLCAALEHAHLLVFHPRDASPGALQALTDAGWSVTEIVTLSQLVAFLTFQIRVVAGLQALAT